VEGGINVEVTEKEQTLRRKMNLKKNTLKEK
jgi:hypothetical protein